MSAILRSRVARQVLGTRGFASVPEVMVRTRTTPPTETPAAAPAESPDTVAHRLVKCFLRHGTTHPPRPPDTPDTSDLPPLTHPGPTQTKHSALPWCAKPARPP